jgi:hypothetical protein
MLIADFFIPDPGSRVIKIPDPGSKNVSVLTQNMVTKLPEI